MRKLFKFIRYFFYIVLGFLVCVIVFLYASYNVLEKKQVILDKQLDARLKTTTISADYVKEPARSEILNLLPVPKKVKLTGGYFVFPSAIVYSAPDSLKAEVEVLLKMIPDAKTRFSGIGDNFQFKYLKTLPVQGYIMDIIPGKVTINYSSNQGLYYALVSLKVLKQNYSGTIPSVHIEDSPDLEVRGMMLDISRDKVPAMETFMGIVQLLADLKYNHFELYVEGFSFAYPSFKNLWEGKETPVTAEEIQELDTFCRAHFIDFVPNQNSLGHMMAWLATDQFKDLAECPNGYKIMGLTNMKGTMDPTDPRSIGLVTKMTNDLLPNFTSSSFNVNLDEPFELGKGKSRVVCREKGEGQVYLDYAIKLHDMLAGKNKKMMMWADIVLRHPELIPKIPKDITLLDWGYESSYPFEKHGVLLQKSGLNYMVCPGTSSWTTITGRTDNMLANIELAVKSGVKYGARGMLLTDWGDMGHWQYLPVSYAGYTAGATLSWNSMSLEDMSISSFLNSYVFRDESSVMGDLAMELGRYNKYEEFPFFNMTTTMLSLQLGLRDRIMISAIFKKVIKGISDLMKDIAPEMISVLKENFENRHSFDYDGLNKFLDSKEAMLRMVKIKSADSLLIRDEYLNSIRLIRLGTGLQSYTRFRSSLDITREKSQLRFLKELGT
ncbi:MAG: glycoside hydrolase family 20 zincin-like fold domain-containing protein, partial [Bacteroidales bacterium]